MASTSGEVILKSNWSNLYGLKFYWNATQTIIKNYDDIKVDMYAYFEGAGTIDTGARNDGYITINGKKKEIKTPAVYKMYNGTAEIYLGSYTERVDHNPDGTLQNVSISGYWPIRATISGIYRNDINGSFGTGEITRIPRASQILSSANFTLGNNFNINLNRYSDSFKHTIELYINDTLIKTYNDIDTLVNVTFNSTEISNLYNSITDKSSVSTKIKVITLSDSESIGTTEKIGTMIIDETINRPDFDGFSWMCDNDTKILTGWNTSVTEDNGKAILTKTKITITCETATAKNSASIVSYEANINGKTYTSNTTTIEITDSINYSDVLKVSAVDSRGFKTTISKQINGLAYLEPAPISAEIKRLKYPNNEKVLVNVVAKITKNSEINNTVEVKYQFKERSTSNWSENENILYLLEDNGTITINTEIDNFDLSKYYDFRLIIKDYFISSNIETIIYKDVPLLFEGDDVVSLFGLPPDNYEKNALYFKDELLFKWSDD